MSAYICVYWYTRVLLHLFVYSYELISFSFLELAFSILEKIIGRGKSGPCVFGRPKRCVSVAAIASFWNYMNHLSEQRAFQHIEGPSHSLWAMPVTRGGGGHITGTRVYYLM